MNTKITIKMAILDKEGYLLERGLIDLNTNSLLQKEFNFLVNNLNFRSREAVLHSCSSKGFMYQIPDAGASFFTVNLYEITLKIKNIINRNLQLSISDLQLSQIFGEFLLEPEKLFFHNDCIDYNSDHYRAILYCDPVSDANGPLTVCPGSHTWASKETVPHKVLPILLEDVENKSLNVSAEAGDVLIFNSKLIHGRESNITKRPNRTITFEFFSKSHLKRIYSFSIPSIHLTKKVIDNIDTFSTPELINSPNPQDLVAKELWCSQHEKNTKGIGSILLTKKSFLIISRIFSKWFFVQITSIFLNKISFLIKFKRRFRR